MAKIKLDTSLIPGFDTFPAEVQAALTAHEFEAPAPDYTGWVPKETFDKKATEAATATKKLRERMDEEERKRVEDADRMAALEEENAALRKRETVATYTAQFAALGYDETLAAETAAAMADGDMEKVFAAQKRHQADAAKKMKADLLLDTPKPAPGAASTGVNYEAMITEALSKGDVAAAAYYTRLQAQEAEH